MTNYYQHNGTSYVHVSDYTALEARLAHAEACLAEKHLRLAEAEALLREAFNALTSNENTCNDFNALRGCIDAFLAADSAEVALTGPRWCESHKAWDMCHADQPTVRAE